MRAPKKTETIEIRLPLADKQAFMDRCRADGRSASEALRAFIDGYVQPPAAPRPFGLSWRWIAGTMCALAVAAAAAPSLAHPSLRGEFQRLDTDGSGAVSLREFSQAASVTASVGALRPVRVEAGVEGAVIRAEFQRIDTNRDGRISLDEFRRRYGR